MDNYKGIYANNNDRGPRYYEGGAHFSYSDLYKRLKQLKAETSTRAVSSGTVDLNIEKQSQSRNIKPLIQSLTQKLSEIVNSSKEQTRLNNTRNKNVIQSHLLSQDKIKKSSNSSLTLNQMNNIKYLNSHNINTIQQGESSNIIESNSKGKNIINNIILKPSISISFVNNTNSMVNQNRYGLSRNSNTKHSNNSISNMNYFSKMNNYTMHVDSNNKNGSINDSSLYHRNNSNTVFTKKYTNLQEKIDQMKMKTKIELERLSKDFEKIVSNGKKETRNKDIKPIIYGNNYSNSIYYPHNNNNEKKGKYKYNYNYQLQRSTNEGEKRIQGRKGNNYYQGYINNKSFLANHSVRMNASNGKNNVNYTKNYVYH